MAAYPQLVLTLVISISMVSCRSDSSDQPASEATRTDQPAVPEEKQPTVVVMFDNPQIGDFFFEWANIRTDTTANGRRLVYGWLGQYAGMTGVHGIADAEAVTQFMIDTYQPIEIIHVGLGVGSDPSYLLGDVVIPKSWRAYYRVNRWSEQNVDTVLLGTEEVGAKPGVLDLAIDSALHARLDSAAQLIAFRLRSVERRLPEIYDDGVGFSLHGFEDSPQARMQMHGAEQASLVDSTTAGVIHVAQRHGIPVASVQSCFIFPTGNLSPTDVGHWKALEYACAWNAAMVVREYLEREW